MDMEETIDTEDAGTVPAGDGGETAAAQPEPRRGRTFFNRFGHLRGGWRLLLYITGVGVIMVVLGLVLPALGVEGGGIWALGVSNLALVGVALVLLRWVDRRPLRLYGLGLSRGWLGELAAGLVAGPVLVSAVALALVACGSVQLSLTTDVAASLKQMAHYLAFFTLAGAAEEFAFRGYPLQVLAEGSRRWIAVALFSLFFAFAHWNNPDMSFVPWLNILLIGIVFAQIYFATLRLWLPIGLHLSWNWAQSCFWGFDVSGIKIDDTLFVATPRGPELLTGGGFGIEGSILTTILIGVLIVVLPRLRPLRATEAMASAWAPYPRGFNLGPLELEHDTSGAEDGAVEGQEEQPVEDDSYGTAEQV